MTTATTPTTTNPTEPEPALTNAVPTSEPAIVTECDKLIQQMDGAVKFTRNTARETGELLSRIKAEVHHNNANRFGVWFALRYRRTPQSALKWMRLAAKWEDCLAAYNSDPSGEKEPWEALSIDDTLKLLAKPRKPKPANDKPGNDDKPGTTTGNDGKHPAEDDPTHAGTRLDETTVITPDVAETFDLLLARFVEKAGERVERVAVKSGATIRIGGKSVKVGKPLLIVPSVAE